MIYVKMYLKVPQPGHRGDECEYVRVEPQRLHLGILNELFVEDGVDGNGKRRYKPAFGVVPIVQPIVVEGLEAKLKEIFEQYEPVLNELGEKSRSRIQTLFVKELSRLEEFIQFLGEGRVQRAEETLSDLLHGLFSGICNVGEGWDRIDTLSVENTRLKQTITDAPDLAMQLYLDWAQAADGLNRSVRQLGEIEMDFRRSLTFFQERQVQ